MRWVWVPERVVLALHEEQLAEHGGPAGVRDRGLLQSALARPENLVAYRESPDAAALAAAYAFGIGRNHPFVDGNKRTAFIVMELFLSLNGWILQANDAECIRVMETLAAGKLSEQSLVNWMREQIRRS